MIVQVIFKGNHEARYDYLVLADIHHITIGDYVVVETNETFGVAQVVALLQHSDKAKAFVISKIDRKTINERKENYKFMKETGLI